MKQLLQQLNTGETRLAEVPVPRAGAASLVVETRATLGVPARSLRGGEAGVRVEGGFGGGRIARVDAEQLRNLLDAGMVPVVSGFQGARGDGETLTLGRGASDLSAVAIAAALGPAECHIVTDVDGVFDRDPRGGAGARFFPRLTHGELLRLAEGGAKVVHPEAAREAQRAGVPLRIHHFRAPLAGEHGTVVTAALRPPRAVSAAAISSPSAEMSARESAKADFGPLLPRIHSPVPTPTEEVLA